MKRVGNFIITAGVGAIIAQSGLVLTRRGWSWWLVTLLIVVAVLLYAVIVVSIQDALKQRKIRRRLLAAANEHQAGRPGLSNGTESVAPDDRYGLL